MKGVFRPRFLSLLVACLLLALSPAATSASSSWIGSGTNGIDNDYFTDFGTGRYISVAGSDILFDKTDGPGIYMQWYKCSNRNVTGPGAAYAYWDAAYFSDPDPGEGTKAVDTNFLSGTTFCLSVMSNGSNDKDEFEGYLYWNV